MSRCTGIGAQIPHADRSGRQFLFHRQVNLDGICCKRRLHCFARSLVWKQESVMHISLGGLSLQAINVSVFLYRDSGLVQRVFCKLSRGRDDFLGGTARENHLNHIYNKCQRPVRWNISEKLLGWREAAASRSMSTSRRHSSETDHTASRKVMDKVRAKLLEERRNRISE